MTLRKTTSSLARKILAAAAVIAALGATAAPALADNWHHGWDRHDGWRGHEWQAPPRYVYMPPRYVYAPPPPVYYAPPPPVVYAPPPAISFSLRF
jgi:hypothetical protein